MLLFPDRLRGAREWQNHRLCVDGFVRPQIRQAAGSGAGSHQHWHQGGRN